PPATGWPASSPTMPSRWPTWGLVFQASSGAAAGSAKIAIGVDIWSSYSTVPSTDLPVVRPAANSANGRLGVGWPAGMEWGLLVTAVLLLAMLKNTSPMAGWPLGEDARARRVWRSVPSIALRDAPWPMSAARPYWCWVAHWLHWSTAPCPAAASSVLETIRT